MTPVFKKKDPLNKEKYRPGSVLPSISKIFEKIMQKQINDYINNFVSPYLCGYRKGFSTQLALVSLTEKMEKAFLSIWHNKPWPSNWFYMVSINGVSNSFLLI